MLTPKQNKQIKQCFPAFDNKQIEMVQDIISTLQDGYGLDNLKLDIQEAQDGVYPYTLEELEAFIKI